MFHSFSCFIGSQFFCHGMLRSQYHEGCTVKGIRAGGVYSDLLVFSFNREFNFCTIGFTDPVTLHLFNFFRPVQFVQIIQQTVCIFCDTQHPLTQIFLSYFRTTTFTFSVDNFFICQTCFTGWTPVDREFFFVSQTFFKHLYKDPLGPFVELRICGVYFAIPVIQSCDFVDLTFDICYVVCG